MTARGRLSSKGGCSPVPRGSGLLPGNLDQLPLGGDRYSGPLGRLPSGEGGDGGANAILMPQGGLHVPTANGSLKETTLAIFDGN